jgi:hypothetical protein
MESDDSIEYMESPGTSERLQCGDKTSEVNEDDSDATFEQSCSSNLVNPCSSSSSNLLMPLKKFVNDGRIVKPAGNRKSKKKKKKIS